MGRTKKRKTTKRKVTRKRKKTKKKKVVRRKKKKPKKKVVGSKRQVFRDARAKTVGGLKKENLVKNKRGRVVSKKAHERGLELYKNNLKGWHQAFMQARKNLKVEGFKPCKKGTPLYEEAMRLYKK